MLLLELSGTDSILSDNMGYIDPALVALTDIAISAWGLLELGVFCLAVLRKGALRPVKAAFTEPKAALPIT